MESGGKCMRMILMGACVTLWVFMTPAWLWAQNIPVLEVGKFSTNQPGANLPDGWKPLTFKKIPRLTKLTPAAVMSSMSSRHTCGDHCSGL